MPTTTNKQGVWTHVFGHLPKAARGGSEGQVRPPEGLGVLEQFLYALCREGTTREQGERAFLNLREGFFDWNEVRVSSLRELAEAFEGLPDAEARAQRVVDFLQEVFETTFSFDLEGLHKKGLKQAAKQLARYQAANDYAVSWVLQNSLDGHSVPLDEPTLRLLRRLGLIEADQEDPEVIRASLEHLVPKARASLFGELLSALAEELCVEDEPNCSDCPLAAECPPGLENHRTVSAGRAGRPKPP